MGLNERLLSSEVQISGYRIQPYKAVADTTTFGNRFLSPEMVAPAVLDVVFETAPVGRVPRDVSATYNTPVPVILRNGASPTAGNNSPRRR